MTTWNSDNRDATVGSQIAVNGRTLTDITNQTTVTYMGVTLSYDDIRNNRNTCQVGYFNMTNGGIECGPEKEDQPVE